MPNLACPTTASTQHWLDKERQTGRNKVWIAPDGIFGSDKDAFPHDYVGFTEEEMQSDGGVLIVWFITLIKGMTLDRIVASMPSIQSYG